MLDVRHSNTENNYALQLAGSFFDQNLWFRKTNNNPSQAWRKIVAENENGNVGIGTQSPGSKLTIKSGTRGVSIHPGLNQYFGTIAFNRESATGEIFDPNGQAFQINNGGGDKNLHVQVYDGNGSQITNDALVISGVNGNVGIGTANPDKLLTLKADSFIGWKYTDDSSTSNHTITGGGINPISFTVNPFSDPNLPIFKFNGSSGTKMSILNGGNVGIGSSNPDEKLTVKGKIHAEEVKIDLAVPADYVFQKYYSGKSALKADYTMPTLDEVAEYIKINEHLPSIPSAADIKKNGVQLGEMSNLLLQKIEELTLYMIEFKKEMSDIKHELIEIKSENKTLKETINKK